jgi:hypothetical protein
MLPLVAHFHPNGVKHVVQPPQRPLREALVEMLARVDRSPLALPIDLDIGKPTVDAMQAGINFVWAAANSFDSRECQ